MSRQTRALRTLLRTHGHATSDRLVTLLRLTDPNQDVDLGTQDRSKVLDLINDLVGVQRDVDALINEITVRLRQYATYAPPPPVPKDDHCDRATCVSVDPCLCICDGCLHAKNHTTPLTPNLLSPEDVANALTADDIRAVVLREATLDDLTDPDPDAEAAAR